MTRRVRLTNLRDSSSAEAAIDGIGGCTMTLSCLSGSTGTAGFAMPMQFPDD
jgi:hypothetical protein